MKIIKSLHFWFWLVYIIGVIFYCYCDNNLPGPDGLLKTMESIELYFTFVGLSGLWLFLYVPVIMNVDV